MWQSSKERVDRSKLEFPVEGNRFFSFFRRFGWMLLFWGACFAFYSHAMREKTRVCFELQGKIQDLELTKTLSLEEQGELTLQIQSQGDADWVEMVLKQRLGMVPEGYTKVYFKKDD